MEFQVKILFMTFAFTIGLSFVMIPLLRKLKVGQQVRDDGPETHLIKQGTPTMGGIIIAIASILTCIFLYYYYNHITIEPQIAKHFLAMLIATIGMGFVGFIDDFKKVVLKNTKGLSPKAKMFGLLIISTAYVIYLVYGLKIGTDIYIPFVKDTITLPVWIYIPFAIFVILGATNAINLTDGIDGLSSSITTVILTAFTVIAIIFNVKEVTLIGSCIAGACLGFLIFNLYPSKVMMGDTGSLFLGGAISIMALYLKMPLLLIFVAIVPIIETLSVMIQVIHYKRTGKRVFKMAPLHHHFELSGWRENKIVSIFSIATLIVSIIAILSI